MAIIVRDFDTMVQDTLLRIVNNTSITNTNAGSVIRTISESILAENDVQYYQLSRIFYAMSIDSSTSEDLDRLIAILGVTRKEATAAPGVLTFSRATPYIRDIPIDQGTIISTLPNRDGTVIEFMVSQEDAFLPAGDLEVDVECIAVDRGNLFLPAGSLTVMNTPVFNIEAVTNKEDIYGGTDAEADDDLRIRAKSALQSLGKGTIKAIETALNSISGVTDAIVIDMANGPGTIDVIVVTATIPPPPDLMDQIEQVLDDTKSAGIKADLVYPTILDVDINITTVRFDDIEVIYNAIMDYCLTLGIADDFIINQMERAVLNASGVYNMDIKTISPANNVVPAGTQIIRAGIVTINGEVYTP